MDLNDLDAIAAASEKKIRLCDGCGEPLDPRFKFCPMCGTSASAGLSTTAGRQAWIYFVSFFLAPFGLGYAVKYAKSRDPKAKRIGWIAVALTVAAVFAIIVVGAAATKSLYSDVNALMEGRM